MEGQPVVSNQVQQPPVSTVPLSKKPSQWIIAGTILLVPLFVFGAIYAFSLPSRKPMSPPPKPLASLPPISSAPDPTSNWKTYTDVANGFSIKYPEDWNEFSVTDKSGGYLLTFILTPQSREPLNEKEADYTPGVHIGVLKMKKCSDAAYYAQTEVETYLKNKDLYPGLDIHLLNLTGIYGYKINKGSPGITAQRGPEVYIFNCKIEIQISLDSTEIQNSEQLFDQILSTFKFLPASPIGGDQNQVVCAQDVKQCADGSYVSRQGQNCEFAACPQK